MQDWVSIRQFGLCLLLHWDTCPGYWFVHTRSYLDGRIEAFRGCWYLGDMQCANGGRRVWRPSGVGGGSFRLKGRRRSGHVGSRGKVSCQLVGLEKVLA